ncbi:unnamed protein product, partial [Symbiodinium microadriaticum]
PEILKEAIEKAFVALPETCATRCALTANFEDNDGISAVHWFGRASDLSNTSWSALRGSILGRQSCVQSCHLQWVILVHGSGGMTYTNWRYAAKLVALGFGVLAPDSMAAPKHLHLRHKDPVVLKKTQTSRKYWAAEPVYKSSCGWDEASGKYPFCYSTKVENLLSEPDLWKVYYERIFLLRRRELDWLLEHMPAFMGSARLFLFGHSEGAMVAARYYHPALAERLSGRIISAWSCEENYFVGSKAGSLICDGQCEERAPVLNIIGTEDQFFSSRNFSVAAQVANSSVHYGSKKLLGHCLNSFGAGNVRSSAVLLLQGASHDVSLTHDDASRSFLSEFLSSPHDFVRGDARSLKLFCKTEKHGLHLCQEDGQTEPLLETESGLAHTVYHFPPCSASTSELPSVAAGRAVAFLLPSWLLQGADDVTLVGLALFLRLAIAFFGVFVCCFLLCGCRRGVPGISKWVRGSQTRPRVADVTRTLFQPILNGALLGEDEADRLHCKLSLVSMMPQCFGISVEIG